MPPKKTARKATQRKSSLPQHSEDLRRAYEYLGRVDILEGALAGTHFVHVTALINLAQQRLATGKARDATELLRAAEHICFAALAPEDRFGPMPVVSAELKEAVEKELDCLIQDAGERWSRPKAAEPHEMVATIYLAAREQATAAFNRCQYRPALELARAAEALTHDSKQPQSVSSDNDLTRQLAS